MKRIYLLLILFVLPLLLFSLGNQDPSLSKSNLNTGTRGNPRSLRLWFYAGPNIYQQRNIADFYYYPSTNTDYPDSVISFVNANMYTPAYRTIFHYDINHEYVQEVLGYKVNVQGISELYKKYNAVYNSQGHLLDGALRTFDLSSQTCNFLERWHYVYTGQELTSYAYTSGIVPY